MFDTEARKYCGDKHWNGVRFGVQGNIGEILGYG